MANEDLEIKEGQDQIDDEDLKQLSEDFKELGVSTEKEKPDVEEIDNEELRNDSEELGPEHDGKSEEEREAIRERRREERKNKKRYQKEKEDSYRREIASLKQQVQEMNSWKNTIEQRRVQSGVAQLDKALQDSSDALELAKRAIKEATDTNNGAALVDAQELYYAARRRQEDLIGLKRQIATRMSQPPTQAIPNPKVVANAQNWMKDKKWYDPTGTDADSRVALTVDNSMAEEGWDPQTSEYWEELDNRLKKYLPHRYNSGYNEPNSGKSGMRPPTGGSSQTRSNSSSSGFVLSPERVRAMKEAGMWEDPVKRKAMIQRYIEQDRKSK